MSVKKILFKALQARLKENIATLKFVDKNMGQLRNLDQFHVFPMPGILIEFGRIEWNGIGNGIKQGLAPVRLMVAFENYSDANSEVTDAERDTALAFFDFCEQVKSTVEGFQGDGFGKFDFVADEEDNDHENFIVTVLEFQTLLTDDSTAKNRNEVPADPDVITKYKRPLERPASTIKTGFQLPGKQ